MAKFVKETFTNRPEFLASESVIPFTEQADNTFYGVQTDENGRKWVRAGYPYPANNETAQGLVYADMDVTDGPQAISVLVDGIVIEERLPVTIAGNAKTAMKKISFR